MSKCISIEIKTSNKNCFYNSAFYGTLDKSIEFKIITIILVEVTWHQYKATRSTCKFSSSSKFFWGLTLTSFEIRK